MAFLNLMEKIRLAQSNWGENAKPMLREAHYKEKRVMPPAHANAHLLNKKFKVPTNKYRKYYSNEKAGTTYHISDADQARMALKRALKEELK
jgi:hypothetical protein